MARPRLRSVVQILLALFAATGFIGLVAEQVYQKLLGTLLGASTPAAATVLAAYFAGLTLGSAGYQRWLRRRVANPILAYAVIEGGVAALLLVLLLLFDRLLILFAPLLSLTRHSEAGLQMARLAVAAVWVVPPTFLMGASLPAIADSLAMLRLPARHRLIALFYTVNLLGAIVGSVAAPYVLFPMLGLDGALTVCAALGAVVCLIAQRIGRSYSAQRLPESRAATAATASRTSRTVILFLALSSGFVFFALETLWVHLLAAVIGNSVYAFATMLTVVLIGLGIGSGISVVILSPDRNTSWGFVAGVIFVSGLALSVTHGLWPAIPHSLALVGRDITTFGAGEFLRFRHALAVVLLPATLLGIWFPSLFRLPDFPKQQIGDFVGKTYAANAIGCVIGALATSFLLLPRFGSETLLSAFAALLIVSGALLAVWQRRAVWPIALVAAIAGLVILNLPSWDRLRLTSGEHVYFSENAVRPDSQLLYFREDAAGGITTVIATRFGPQVVRTLLTNGKFQGNDAGETTAQAALGIVPALLTRDFDDALVIGAGTGATAEIVHALGFRNVRIAEIAPPIVDAARREFGALNQDIFDQPNVKTDIEDGRNVLLLDREARYDLITIEITSIWFSDATNLYSREFYQVARSRLRPHGVLQQWIQLHHIEPYDVLSVVATMRKVFPYVSLWAIGGQGIVIGSDEPQRIRVNGLNHVRRLAPRMDWKSDEEFARGIGAIAHRQLLSPAAVDRLLQRFEPIINTDRNRFLEYSTPRSNLNRRATVESTIQRLSVFSDRATPAQESQSR